jgi:hypothetical protein
VAIGLAAQGPEEIGAHLDRLFTAVPDLSFDVRSGFVSGDQAVVEWTVSGTYRRDFSGLPPRRRSALLVPGGLGLRASGRPDPPLHRVLGCLRLPGAARSAAVTRLGDARHADVVGSTETAER